MKRCVTGKPKLTPALAENLRRRRRRGKVGRNWYVDETYVKATVLSILQAA
jgi:transposase-like protein